MELSKVGYHAATIKPIKLKLKTIVGSANPLTEEQKTWDGKLIPTASIEGLKYPFEFLNPVQSEFYCNRFLDANFIVSASTSSGKTVIAELAKVKKILYLSPLRALSQEKLDDWSSAEHTWSKLNIAISTGDYQLTADRVAEFQVADIIIMTSEMLDSRSRNMLSERNLWLKDIDTLIVDEFHLIGYEGRGDKLESALIRFTEYNPTCRIVCLSATMPNVEEIADWLTRLNKKKTVVINSTYRPVVLHRHYPQYMQVRNYGETEEIKVNTVRSIIESRPNDKIIAFVHTKAAGKKLKDALDNRSIRSEFHNADLSKDERIRIQAEFNNSSKTSLRVIIATSTLAWGINTPADTVIITGLHRGINLISNQDIHQMCGRAGRIGKTAQGVGNAYVLVPDKGTEEYIRWCEKIDDVISRMNLKLKDGLEVLCFHIIAEVLGERINSGVDLLSWYERTLARYQGVELDVEGAEEILSTLEKIKMLRYAQDTTAYATGLGKVSAYLYYSPFDIYGWYRNFQTIFGEYKEPDALLLSWALGKIDANDMGYIPAPALDEVNRWNERLRKTGLEAGNTAHVCATYYHLLKGTANFPMSLIPFKRYVQMDFDRINQALKLIDKLYASWHREQVWDNLKWQIKYGVAEHLLDLVQLPSIGAVRAKNLYEAGVKNREEFMSKASIAKAVVGPKLYGDILRDLEILGK